MKLIQSIVLVVLSVFMSLSVVEGNGDISISGKTTTNALTLSGLDCTANANGGALMLPIPCIRRVRACPSLSTGIQPVTA